MLRFESRGKFDDLGLEFDANYINTAINGSSPVYGLAIVKVLGSSHRYT